LNALKKDVTIVILPADKCRATVLMDKTVYDTKMLKLLNDKNTYKKLKADSTNKYQNQLVNILRNWQRENLLPLTIHRRIYPTSEDVPKIYGTPKIHKPDFPLRPIVSSIGSIAYQAARLIADILSPLVGKTDHNIKNSQDFVLKIKDLQIPPGHVMHSYDVTALFMSILVPAASIAARGRLMQDDKLADRTKMSVEQVMTILEFCLNTTYFMYKGDHYQQTEGAAMGSQCRQS
jgi:hypothetical protein